MPARVVCYVQKLITAQSAKWDGTNWTKMPVLTSEHLYGVAMASADEGWAVGREGTILAWDGANWQLVDHKFGDYYRAVAYTVRDRLMHRWHSTANTLMDKPARAVAYLSAEYLLGPHLVNNLINLGIMEKARAAGEELELDFWGIMETEEEPGLGNGGLGRLASCFLDSMACRNLPGYGYGIRYDYGIFHQVLENGYQREHCDNWMRRGNPWEIQRLPVEQPIRFYGRSETYTDGGGELRYRWVDGEVVMAVACDILIPGYGDDYVTKPFSFEGGKRMKVAEQGIEQLSKHVDSLITIPNERLLSFGYSELPGQTRMLQGGQRRGPGSSIVSRDEYDVSLRFGHTGGDRSDADL